MSASVSVPPNTTTAVTPRIEKIVLSPEAKAKVETEYTNTKACADSAGPISTQQPEELYGLELPPWDNNHWSQCCKCKRWFRNELVDNSCHNCTELPSPIV